VTKDYWTFDTGGVDGVCGRHGIWLIWIWNRCAQGFEAEPLLTIRLHIQGKFNLEEPRFLVFENILLVFNKIVGEFSRSATPGAKHE
jgi:hypothetical protein